MSIESNRSAEGIHQRKRRSLSAHRSIAALLACLLANTLAGSALAIDGVIEINQTKVLAGGVTPGDAAGFPATINASGSYVLTSNLTVPSLGDDAIEVAASDVTIDLNGFSIDGTMTCSGSGASLSCTGGGPAGTGVGGTPYGSEPPRTEVKNGTIHGFPAAAIRIGDECRVSDLRISENSAGVFGGTSCSARDNVVSRNDFIGISLDAGAKLQSNVAAGNTGVGIAGGSNSVIIGNTSRNNNSVGIFCGLYCLIQSNASSGNAGGISAAEYSIIIENTASNNTGSGIFSHNGWALVKNNTADSNDSIGIYVGQKSLVEGNTASNNGDDGIQLGGNAIARGNTASSNTAYGLDLGATTGYAGNVVSGNTTGTVSAGVEIGPNLCNGTTVCP